MVKAASHQQHNTQLTASHQQPNTQLVHISCARHAPDGASGLNRRDAESMRRQDARVQLRDREARMYAQLGLDNATITRDRHRTLYEAPPLEWDHAAGLVLAAACAAFDRPAPEAVVVGHFTSNGAAQSSRGLLSLLSHLHALGHAEVWIPADGEHIAAFAPSPLKVRTFRDGAQLVCAAQGEVLPLVTPQRLRECARAGEARVADVLLVGRRGTHAARRIADAQPAPTPEIALEILRRYNDAGVPYDVTDGCVLPPFRAPHHTCSTAGLLQELRLAHGGTLLLDQIEEFSARALEALAAERARGATQCTIIATSLPCPCGIAERAACACPVNSVTRHRARAHAASLCVLAREGDEYRHELVV